MWEQINPHMLFYAFLPALISAEAMRINIQLASKCFWQIFLLACPGVLIGTAMIATFSAYVLPYGWDWPMCIVFGAILSATDPVAVVALFNTLGVSPRLTMLISGESLLNDGTAMVVFALMLKVVLHAKTTPFDVLLFFANMSITSVVFGLIIGRLATVGIGMCAEESYHSDMMIQVIITIATSFLSFFLAESELSSSGVLATVVSGTVIAQYAWPRFVSSETMHTVWETIEFIGNTIIFFLSGLLFANLTFSRKEHLTTSDVGWLFLLYGAVIVIRAVMVILLWIPLNLAGTKLEFREGIVIVWSGLRGAIGLAMAIIVDMEPEISRITGSRVMFLVGGLAGLTTVVNATTSGPLLAYLGLTKADRVKLRILDQFAKTMQLQTREAFNHHLLGVEVSRDIRFEGANEKMVRAMVPALDQAEQAPPHALRRLPTSVVNPEKFEREQNMLRCYCREVFLRVVQSHYWSSINDGLVRKNGYNARLLLMSVNEALDDLTKLSDWDVIERRLGLTDLNQVKEDGEADRHAFANLPWWLRIMNKYICSVEKLDKFRSSSMIGLLPQEVASFIFPEKASDQRATVALTYLEAHRKARLEVFQYFGTGDEYDSAIEAEVVAESEALCERAAAVFTDEEGTELARSRMLARKLLQLQTEHIAHMREKGLVTEMEATDLEHVHVHSALRRLVHAPRSTWIDAKSDPVSPSPSALTGMSWSLSNSFRLTPQARGVVPPSKP